MIYDATIIAALILAIGGIFAALINVIYRIMRDRREPPALQPQPETPEPEPPDVFENAVLPSLKLSKAARTELRKSRFIFSGGTRNTLFDLVSSAIPGDSILAVCGAKGTYSESYYDLNFTKYKSVKRIFSYDAIQEEIAVRKKRYALEGLNHHIEMIKSKERTDELFLIQQNTSICDTIEYDFNPPISFGLAIPLDRNGTPRGAVLHWEVATYEIKHLINIEGIVIEAGYEKLLEELVMFHDTIANSNLVLSWKNQANLIKDARAKLEETSNKYKVRKEVL